MEKNENDERRGKKCLKMNKKLEVREKGGRSIGWSLLIQEVGGREVLKDKEKFKRETKLGKFSDKMFLEILCTCCEKSCLLQNDPFFVSWHS